MSNKKITAFCGVFESRLTNLKKDLKKELERAKSERRKEWIRRLLREAKALRDLVRELKPKCPHCGGDL